MATINGTVFNDGGDIFGLKHVGLVGTDESDVIRGYSGNDILIGHDGDDVLDGGSGIDSMYGEAGNDTYVVDHAQDIVIDVDYEYGPELSGYDTILSYIDYTLPAHIERLELVEDADAIRGVGNDLDNDILGNRFNNQLLGMDGDDAIWGFDGQDRIWGGRGVDTLSGGDGDDRLYGEQQDDILYGGAGNDIVDGGSGRDAMFGGGGDDTYFVSNDFDLVTEYGGQGRDTVFSALGSYTLPANVEDLVLESGAGSGRGNDMDNQLVGNDQDNSLQGQGGDDTLYGLEGDDALYGGLGGTDHLHGGLGGDSYLVRDSLDIVHEEANEGTDTVLATFSYTLGTNLENLDLVIGAAGRGNALANNITGNAGNNTLEGYSGSDTLDGGGGDDNIFGGIGNDTLIGGADRSIDRLTGGAGFDTFLYQSRDDSRAFTHRTGDAIQDFNVDQDRIDLRALDMDASDLLIANRVLDGFNFSTVTEDANGNGILEQGEFSILVRIEGAGFVTAQDLLL